jgi:hypothetical protein
MKTTMLYNKRGKVIGVLQTWKNKNLGTDIFMGNKKTPAGQSKFTRHGEIKWWRRPK